MTPFSIQSSFHPAGDQPAAIDRLSRGLADHTRHQTLVGVTGSGKTFTVANVIARSQKPTLIISHNKTLAHQLYHEFKAFFPENSVHYFVSYYDYYQPEAYIPQTDTYIDKDVKINEELDRLRHEATQAVLSRSDVIVIASVSCIYNIGSPESYESLSVKLFEGQKMERKELLNHCIAMQYQRNDIEHLPGTFTARGEIVRIYSASGDATIQATFDNTSIVALHTAETIINPAWKKQPQVRIFPAKYWVAESKKIPLAIANIESELADALRDLRERNKLVEAQRLEQRTHFDMEMLKSAGYCHGIENYSSHMEFRRSGSPPYTLIDYFAHAYGNDFLVAIDESHMTIPQVRGMYHGDRARKTTLIDYGFRLPSARDNRPLTFEEFEKKLPQILYMSATPADYELEKSHGAIVEQLVRPTGLLDPLIIVRPTEHQVQDAMEEIKKRVVKKQRALVTVLTKRMAEDMAEFLVNKGIRAHYLHSEVKTLERAETLRDLRAGEYDVIVGVNLLREGLDLPEVSLVLIMDADKEGFLRNKTTLIQTMGRAARHVEGTVVMYGDTMTRSMSAAIDETQRRRAIQERYNTDHGIVPQQIQKPIAEKARAKGKKDESDISLDLFAETGDVKKLIAEHTKDMKRAAAELDFQEAERLKQRIKKLKRFA